jgi:sterol desaturase/sphingolipid hydroxylase (fatty acid hydroxylase superfamily)
MTVFLGAFAWSFVEYAMHRFNGHELKGRTEFSREHLRHHREEGYFTPTPRKLVAAFVVLAPMLALTTWVGAPGFTLGFAVMYAFYEWLHRDVHVRAPWGAYGRWARRHHLHHHHRNPRSNHGVTSPVWDRVFGTFEQPERLVLVPSKAPRWVLDGEGAVAEAYSGDYALRAPRTARGAPLEESR